MLDVRNLNAGYGGSQVLFNVDLRVEVGEVVTLLGRNGMGKTTLISAVTGILKVASGVVRFDDALLQGLPPFRVARHGIGLVPEGRQVFPNLTVRENLCATAANRFKHEPAWTLDAVLDLFPILSGKLDRFGRLLSGGEQQMVAIGRALMTNPKLLILDEATEGLAPLVRQEIWNCLKRVKAAGQAILVTDKNVKALTRLADRHYILERGRVVLSCGSAALLENPEFRQRFLGV